MDLLDGSTPLQAARRKHTPTLPTLLKNYAETTCAIGGVTSAAGDVDKIKAAFPTLFGQRSVDLVAATSGDVDAEEHFGHGGTEKVAHSLRVEVSGTLRVGVVLSGGQAPGGHNVIAGLFDWVVKQQGGVLYGFENGPIGVMTGAVVVLDDAKVDAYRNMGGFDMIGSGRDKIHSEQQFADSLKHCEALKLNGVVVIGGDDSNTNACMLAEYFASHGTKGDPNVVPCAVLGAPKTIDNDMKNEYVPVSFGFDTACAVYAEQIGNVALDALAEKSTYHWIRVMGRSASHIGLECALQTQPNFAFVGEEVKAKNSTLSDLTSDVANIVCERFEAGKEYGVGIVPEGLIEFIPEVGRLIAEISEVVAEVGGVESFDAAKLSAASAAVFTFLPAQFQKQLLLDRDSHGNVNVSGIETEKLLSLCVEQELARRAAAGDAVAAAAAQTYTAAFHFFGYEGRSALPSQFDCDYCYALGFNAGLLLSRGFTGMISSVGDLDKPAAEWSCGGMPHTNMMNVERRSGGDKCVIKKALTELEGLPFLTFARSRDRWAVSDCYRSPGPMQFQGPSASRISITLQKEYEQKRGAALAPIKSLASLRARDPTPLSTLPQANDFGGLKPSADVKPIAVVVAGSSVPGINNTIAALAAWHRGQVNAATVAFVGGVASLVAETPSLKELSAEELHEMANSGGCDIMGCGGIGDDLAAMLGDDAKAAAAARNMAPYAALVLIGGIAALNAASVLAALKTGVPVIVLPASIANDVGCNVDISLGFDSASRTASQLVGNMATDCNSAKKYWQMVAVTGYSSESSALALETSLQCCPNVCLLAESTAPLAAEIAAIATLVLARRAAGKNFGVVVISDAFLTKHLLADEAAVGALVASELETRPEGKGKYKALCHHFSYQLRCTYPSGFDCRLGHALGVAAATHVHAKTLSTDIATVVAIRGVTGASSTWKVDAIALTAATLATAPKPVSLAAAPYRAWRRAQPKLGMAEMYRNPGPIQLPSAVEETPEWTNLTLQFSSSAAGVSGEGRMMVGIGGVLLAVVGIAAVVGGGYWWSTQKKANAEEEKPACHHCASKKKT